MSNKYNDCQFLYLKLIKVLNNPITEDSAVYYINNFKETTKCDQFNNYFELFRNDLGARTGDNKLKIEDIDVLHKYQLINSLLYYNRSQYFYRSMKRERNT